MYPLLIYALTLLLRLCVRIGVGRRVIFVGIHIIFVKLFSSGLASNSELYEIPDHRTTKDQDPYIDHLSLPFVHPDYKCQPVNEIF